MKLTAFEHKGNGFRELARLDTGLRPISRRCAVEIAFRDFFMHACFADE